MKRRHDVRGGRARTPWQSKTVLSLGLALGATAALGCTPESEAETPDDDLEGVEEAQQAYTTTGYKWKSKSYSIRANLTSFQNNLGTLNLTSGQAEFWITYALSNWKERTGADLTLGYAGTTTSGCGVQNNENGVAAQSGCLEPGCTTWAQNTGWHDGTGGYTEQEVCVYGGSATWSVASNGFPAANKDLVGVLAHEFGHAIGLGHTAGTIMDSPTHDVGNTLSRHPYGDDATGMRALYGTKTRNLLWAKYDGSTWGGTNVLTSGMQMHATGAMGVGPGWSQMIVAGHLDPNVNVMHFTRASVPLSAGSAWVNRALGVNSWRPPAVAARPTSYSPAWVAAWSNATTTLGCTGISLLLSYDVFDSGWLQTLPSDCSLHEPALAYDNMSGRFVLTFTSLQSGTNEANNGRMYARTSTDGWNWTAPQDLGVYTIDAPRMTCAMGGQCILAYVNGGVDPFLTNTAFTVNGDGTISFGSTTWVYAYTQRTPPVAVQKEVSWAWNPKFTIGIQWTSSANDLAKGYGGFWTADSATAPVSSFNWVGTGQWTDHRLDLVASPDVDHITYALITAF